MSSSLATVAFVIGILGLFAFERRQTKISWAAWIPMVWLFISGSRHVSAWMNGLGGAMSQEQYLEGSPLDAAVYGLLIVAGGAVLIARWKKVSRILMSNMPLVIFILYCALSVAWSDYPGVAMKRWIKSLGDYSAILILLTEAEPAAAVVGTLSRVSFVILPLSILFIKYIPALGRTYASHWVGTQFYVGVCDNKNMLGMVCMIFGFASVCRFLQVLRGPRKNKKQGLIVYGSMAASGVWLLLLSDSKTSLACFVLTSGLVVGHVYFKTLRRRAVVLMATAFTVGSSFAVLFLGIGSGALTHMGRNSTLTGRTDIWAALFTVPINPMLGTGFESFWLGDRLAYLWSIPIVYGITEAHNGYLEMYLNLGYVGVVLLAVMIWTGFRKITLLLQSNPGEGRLCFGYFLIALIYNFTEAGFRSTDLIWIGFILSVVLQTALSPVRKTRPAPSKRIDLHEDLPLSQVS